MFERGIAKFGICTEGSLVIGDKPSDLEAGFSAGLSSGYLVESGHIIPEWARSSTPYDQFVEVAQEVGECFLQFGQSFS